MKNGLLTLPVNNALSEGEEIRVQKPEGRAAIGADDAQAASGAGVRRQQDTNKTMAFRLARTPQARHLAKAGPWLNDTVRAGRGSGGKNN